MNTLDKVREFYEKEYNYVADIIPKNYHWATPIAIKNSAIQRCLGVAFLAQSLGCEFEAIDELYLEYKIKIENL